MIFKRKSGFSLVEVLLALSIGGIVLVVATSLLVTISRTWANRPATRDAFDAHVNGVDHFLTAIIEEASISPFSKNSQKSIDLKSPIGFSEAEDPLIYLYLKEAPPLFDSQNGKSTRVHTYLFPNEAEGLSLLWFTDLQELEKDEGGDVQPAEEDELKRTIISPFCQEVFYCYYGEEGAEKDDIKNWEFFSELQESEKGDGYRMPASMKLVFRWENENLERTITLSLNDPAPSGIEEEPR